MSLYILLGSVGKWGTDEELFTEMPCGLKLKILYRDNGFILLFYSVLMWNSVCLCGVMFNFNG